MGSTPLSGESGAGSEKEHAVLTVRLARSARRMGPICPNCARGHKAPPAWGPRIPAVREAFSGGQTRAPSGDEGQLKAPVMGPMSVFPQVHALPGPEGECPISHRDAQARMG